MFRVKVTGEYIARSPVSEKEKIKKTYEIEGNIPTVYAALSVVKNKLLVPALTRKYPDYVSYLTHHIVEMVPLDEKSVAEMGRAEISFMNREQLIRYVKDNAIGACRIEVSKGEFRDFPNLDARYYPDLFKLREAVKLAKEDPVGYQKQFILRQPDLLLDLEMAECNPELFPEQETPQSAGLRATVSLPDRADLSDSSKASSVPALAKKTGDRLKGLQADQVRDGEMGVLDGPKAGDL